MTWNISTKSTGFEDQFIQFLNVKRDTSDSASQIAQQVIDEVRTGGDEALCRLTQQFDRWLASPEKLRVAPQDFTHARQQVDDQTYDALAFAAERIHAFHTHQRPEDYKQTEDKGVTSGWRWQPVQAAGLYVPGGTASYPSSVLMNAVPARVAGVQRLVIVVPTPDGHLNPLVLLAASLAGVDEVYRVGGAQAIAALAYGTASIRPVDVIVGPGNAYVAAAKRQVFGQVGIDMIAGPSEVMVIADANNDPRWLAADLLAQAEHDTAAQSILLSDSATLLAAVAQEVETQLGSLARASIAAQSWRQHGALIEVDKLEVQAPEICDRIAPEHLHIATSDPERLFARVRNAGSVFLGAMTPEPIGDYVAGPNHVLPTGGAARYASGLGVTDFMKRTSFLSCTPDGLAALGPAAMMLARAEGLTAHENAIAIRSET